MNRLTLAAITLALTGWGLFFWQLSQPKPEPQTITKIEYRDRIVAKAETKVKTITKPNGTKIEVITKSDTIQSDHKVTKSEQIVTHQPRYSLGIDIRADQWGIGHRAYDVQIGYRIGDLPLWQTLTISTDHSLAVGFRYEF